MKKLFNKRRREYNKRIKEVRSLIGKYDDDMVIVTYGGLPVHRYDDVTYSTGWYAKQEPMHKDDVEQFTITLGETEGGNPDLVSTWSPDEWYKRMIGILEIQKNLDVKL